MLVTMSQETTDVAHFRTLIEQGIPVVLFDRVSEDLEVNKVIVDDFEGAYGAVSYLIGTGRRRIAHLAGTSALYVSRKRREGYEAAMRDHGLILPEGYIICGFRRQRPGGHRRVSPPPRPRYLGPRRNSPDRFFQQSQYGPGHPSFDHGEPAGL